MNKKIIKAISKNISFLLVLILMGCQSSNDGWVELFNGENFEGWHTYGAGKTYDGWTVENNELIFDFKLKENTKSSNLMTDKQYTNFELSMEWNISEQGNSGVFWGVVEDSQYEFPYQTGPEIQILDDTWKDYVEGRGDINRAGSLYGLMPPSEVVSKGPGSWNHFLLHIDHNENIGFLEFNGKEVLRFPVHGPEWETLVSNSSFADWKGFGKAKTGYISLQDHGGSIAFRNIKIRVLD